MPKELYYFVFVAAAVLLYGILLPFGLEETPDTVYYFSVGQQVAAGEGLLFRGQMVHLWPPGYPLLIGGMAWLTGGPAPAAAMLLACCLYLLWGCYLFRWFVREGITEPAALGWSLLLLFSAVAEPFLLGWSEPPLITISTVFFYYGLSLVRQPQHLGLSVICGLLLLIMVMVRYIGLAYGLGVSLLLLLQLGFSVRLVKIILPFWLPTLAFLWWWRSQGEGSRSLGLYFDLDDKFGGLYDTALRWFLAGPWWLAPFVIMGVLYLVYLLWTRRQHWQLRSPANSLLLVCIAAYVGFLLLSMFFIEPRLAFTPRLLSPVAVPGYLLLVLLWRDSAVSNVKGARMALIAAIIGSAASGGLLFAQHWLGGD